jgi:hypothetical protein
MVRILSVRARDWWSSCEAPPGYAKMASTPSRMRHSTTQSEPFISLPISAWGNEEGEVDDFIGAEVGKRSSDNAIEEGTGKRGLARAIGLWAMAVHRWKEEVRRSIAAAGYAERGWSGNWALLRLQTVWTLCGYVEASLYWRRGWAART